MVALDAQLQQTAEVEVCVAQAVGQLKPGGEVPEQGVCGDEQLGKLVGREDPFGSLCGRPFLQSGDALFQQGPDVAICKEPSF